MAKLPQIKRISLEDFKDAPKEIKGVLEKLIFILNGFLTAVYDALAGNLSAPDNIIAVFKQFEITAGANPEDNTFNFTHNLRTRPQACYVVKAEEVAGTTNPITSAVYVSWHLSEDQSQIEIDSISGLTNTNMYRITVKVE